MTDKPRISQSRANRWNTCKMSYHNRYNLKLKRRRVARPLTFGSSVHKVIEDKTQGVRDIHGSLRDWAKQEIGERKYFIEEVQMFNETVDEAWTIMKEYDDFWPKDHLTYMKVKGRKSEHEIYWEPPGEDFAIFGKVDAYAKSRNKLQWLVEHKSGKNMLSEDDRWRSIQVAIYDKVGREIGMPEVDGIVWDMVKSKPPAKPYLLKNGTFSLKLIDSLPSVVYETIQAEGQDPNDYPTLLANAEKTRSNWFQRVFQPVTDSVRSHLYGEFVDTARDIIDNGHKRNQMTIGRHCSWCDFEPICRAIMTGDDPEYVMEREYTVATSSEKTKADNKPTSKKKVKPAISGRRRRRFKPANAKK